MVLRAQLAQRDRQPVEAVEVGAVLEDGRLAVQRGGNRLFGGVLPTLPVTPITSTP